MQQHLVLKAQQTLIQAPQQILRSELIQLPQLLLEARFHQEFEQNPMLEEVEELDQQTLEDDGRMESAAVEEAKKESEDAEAKESEKEETEVDWDTLLNDEDDQYEYRSNRAITEPVEIPQAEVRTLSDTLYDQLYVDRFSPKEMEVGEYIIGSLDQRGYLNATPEEIAKMVDVPLEDVEEVLYKVQRYEPYGIAARNLQECLVIQLEMMEDRNEVAYLILRDHYDSFINRRFESIADELNVSPQHVQEAFNAIAQLNPRPGEGVINEKLNYIIPDLLVEEIGGEMVVSLNDGNIPSFSINEELKKLILNKKESDKKAREFAIRKYENAKWFMNAIQQRRTTMVRTMRAIVDKQMAWFKSGKEVDLRPMILEDIAQEIEMDISTISRVTREKYVQTPYGVFELKYFFNDRMETISGEEVNTRTIKAKLKEIIDAENKAKPLSDQQIADELKKYDFKIARRTVQKYREQLNIPVKRLRRQVVL